MAEEYLGCVFHQMCEIISMENIALQFLNKKQLLVQGIPYQIAELKIDGVLKERSRTCLEWWSKEDYEQQWKEGLERLISHNQSCLITNIRDPRKQLWIELYGLYKVDGKINIQAFAYFGEESQRFIGIKPFTIKTCYDFIPPRAVDENIDQWFTSVEKSD